MNYNGETCGSTDSTNKATSRHKPPLIPKNNFNSHQEFTLLSHQI